jgi:hypothetical protein
MTDDTTAGYRRTPATSIDATRTEFSVATIVVEGTGTIRLIGMDTPETVDPRRPVQYFGKEASEIELKMEIMGKLKRSAMKPDRVQFEHCAIEAL